MTDPDPPVRVQRSRRAGSHLPAGVVYVGRPSKWGNPHRSPPFRPDVAAARYEQDLLAGRLPITVDEVRAQLRGRDLACWCPPGHPCHADILLRVANS